MSGWGVDVINFLGYNNLKPHLWEVAHDCEWGSRNQQMIRSKSLNSHLFMTFFLTICFFFCLWGLVACHSIRNEYRDCADQTGCGTRQSAWGRSWDIEACRQIVYTTSTNNVTDMFPVREWGPEELSKYCKQTWNITPEITWFQPWLFLAFNFSKTLCVSFSLTLGVFDPWFSIGLSLRTASFCQI